MEEIEKWYADKIGKTPEEFDAIDKHIERVLQTWEIEREQALSMPSGLTCMMCRQPKEKDGHTCCEDCAGLAF